MRQFHKLPLGLLILAALTVAAPAAAEITCGNPDCTWVKTDQGMTEEPDPLTAWAGYLAQLGYPVNPNGDLRGDGPPAFGVDPLTGLPVGVWSYNVGQSFEIAFTTWTGEGWSQPSFLTANAASDLDPRIHADGRGAICVVWWVQSTSGDRVKMARRNSETAPFDLERVIAENGRRPAVVGFGEQTLIAFERPISHGQGHQVVVQTWRQNLLIREEVLATTPRTAPLGIRLRIASGKAVISWKNSERFYGYSEYINGRWGISADVWLGSIGGSRDRLQQVVGIGQ